MAGIIKFGMLICCALMLAPVICFLVTGSTLAGLAANWMLFLLLAICAGVHFMMHRTMGASCRRHGKPTGSRSDASTGSALDRKEKP